MAETIVPTLFDVADDLDFEINSLAVALGMARDELISVQSDDRDTVSQAIERLYFLTDSLGAIKDRLASIAESTHRIGAAARQAGDASRLQ